MKLRTPIARTLPSASRRGQCLVEEQQVDLVDAKLAGALLKAVQRLIRWRLEHAETERGHLDAVMEGYGFHRIHFSVLGHAPKSNSFRICALQVLTMHHTQIRR